MDAETLLLQARCQAGRQEEARCPRAEYAPGAGDTHASDVAALPLPGALFCYPNHASRAFIVDNMG
jgi:hypothetical protein